MSETAAPPTEEPCPWCDGVGRSGRFVCEVCQPDAMQAMILAAGPGAEPAPATKWDGESVMFHLRRDKYRVEATAAGWDVFIRNKEDRPPECVTQVPIVRKGIIPVEHPQCIHGNYQADGTWYCLLCDIGTQGGSKHD